MSDIVLSFCITTRNRAATIRDSLDNLLSRIGNGVEVVVVDGASTDGTREVCEAIARRDARLRYFRMEDNGGVDRDYDRAVTLARGTYCWMMSDDDELRPGAVERILSEIGKGYVAIVVNAEDRDHRMLDILREKRLPIEADHVYVEGDDGRLFRDLCHHLSFIPCLVVRRDFWLSRAREPYFGSWFVHVGVLFQSPIPGPCLAVADPLVRIRNGNISWGPRSFEIWMSRWPALVWSFDRMPAEYRESICPRHPWRSPKELLVYRAMAAYGPDEYRSHILRAPGVSPFFRIVARVIAVLPGSLVNRLCILFCRIARAEDRFTLFNLKTSPYFTGSRVGR